MHYGRLCSAYEQIINPSLQSNSSNIYNRYITPNFKIGTFSLLSNLFITFEESEEKQAHHIR